MISRYMLLPASLLLAGLAGCASVPADWGRADVVQLASDRGRSFPADQDARRFTDKALRAPLTADAAVQLALLNNPAVRRETAQLGFAAAELYDAGRLANPTFSFLRLSGDSSAGANMPQLTLGIAFNFANLLFLPANTRFAKAGFEAAKLNVAAIALDLAANVEQAWFEAVGADQVARMRDAAAKAQQASAALAQRFYEAGNINPRELAMERAAASQASLSAISAKAAAVEARTSLNRLMGLSAAQDNWTLDARLPELPSQEPPIADLQQLAMDSRLDIQSLRLRAEAIADRYGVTRRTRLVNGIEVGAERERDFDGALNVGPTLSLELPLFNWGGGRVAAIQAALDQAEAELDQAVLDASNDVQLAIAKIGAKRSLADEYRQVLIPAQDAVVDQAQLEQNFMLIGIFEVILAKQQAYDAYAGYLESIRDYWIARSELSRAVGRDLPIHGQKESSSLSVDKFLQPKGGGADHSQHSMGGMKHDMKSMKGMEGMPMNDMGGSAAEGRDSPSAHEGHSMKQMPDAGSDAPPPKAPSGGPAKTTPHHH